MSITLWPFVLALFSPLFGIMTFINRGNNSSDVESQDIKQLAEEVTPSEPMDETAAQPPSTLNLEPSARPEETLDPSRTPAMQVFMANGVSFNMIRVEGGTFTMGATSEQGSDADDDEKPAHQETVSSFYIGETEVTQALWLAVMGSNPSYIKGNNLPVEQVSWDECQTFISKLNSLTDKNFRLPTEAEWEFAARGGNKSQGYKYSGSNTIDDVAWYYDNSTKGTHPVKTKSPNELGIYDMSGNVWEWTQSCWRDNYNAAEDCSDRVYRGGCWFHYARYCRMSFRDYFTPGKRSSTLGLRLAL